MATPGLTSYPFKCPATPTPGEDLTGIAAREHLQRIGAVAGSVWLLTATSAAAAQIAPALAPSAHPHPTLHGTLAEIGSVIATNLRVLAAPFLLAAFHWPRGRLTRTLGDLVIATLIVHNTLTVGFALGHWGGRLLPYVPQLPLEWTALATAGAAWLMARHGVGLGELARYALATLALTVSAGAVEVLLTPHTDTGQRTERRVLTLADERSVPPYGERVPVVFAGFCAAGGQGRFKVARSLPLTHSVRFRSAARPALPDYVNHPIPTRRDQQMLNRVILIGRLTSDPTLDDRSGTQVGRLRLAVQRPRGKDGEDRGADFVDVTVFGNQAQVCNQYLAKGRRVAIEGRLQHSEWQAEDGSRRQKLEVIASSIEFLDRKPSDDQAPEAVEAAA